MLCGLHGARAPQMAARISKRVEDKQLPVETERCSVPSAAWRWRSSWATSWGREAGHVPLKCAVHEARRT